MTERHYRAPTEIEQEFLRIVTRGYPEVQQQIKECDISQYDPTGWSYVQVRAGPPSPIRYMAEGPQFKSADPNFPLLGILLWTDTTGMLVSIEFLNYAGIVPLVNPYRKFIEAARTGILQYFNGDSQSHELS